MNENEIIFSVIINCYNSEKFIRECVNSVLNQSYQNFEVIIVDNFSTDNTRKEILALSDQRIRYFKTDSFLQLGEARNFGLNLTKGNYIAFLDSDDYWHEDKLRETIKYFKKDIGVVYSNVKYFGDHTSFHLYDKRTPYEGNVYNFLLNDYSLCLSSIIFLKKNIVDNNIKFNSKFNVCEDFDFFVRLAKHTSFKYINKVLTYYRIHENNLTSKKRLLFFYEIEEFYSDLHDLDKKLKKKLLFKNNLNKSIYHWKINDVKNARLTLFKSKGFIFQKLLFAIIFIIPWSIFKFIYQKSLFD